MAVFLREDGQLALGTKTPVTILQETLQKKGISPHYELIYNGVGTPEPRFKFRVSAEGMTAIGDGKSKKEAKHDAAASLLKRLMTQTNKAVTETEESVATCREGVDIASPYTGALKTNYVGMLDEICVVNKIPLPNYVPVREEGPPHARVFTMQCNIASISETAVARTKKQAKHLVAQQMVSRVANILGSRFVPVVEKEDEIAMEEMGVSRDLKAIENGTFRHDLSFYIRDIHNVFHIRKDELPLPSIFIDLPEKPEKFYESLENPKEFLEELVHALEGVVTTVPLSVEDFKQSLAQIMAAFHEDSEESEYEEDSQEDSDIENEELNKALIEKHPLEDFPLDDETEINEDGQEKINIENEALNETLVEKHSLQDFPLEDETEIKEDSKKKINIENEELNKALVEKCTLQDFPQNDETEINKQKLVQDFGKLTTGTLGAKEECTNICKDKLYSKSDNETDIVSVFLKVEVPRGVWNFLGRGSSDQEALNRASIDALKFFRLMAIPPPTNID